MFEFGCADILRQECSMLSKCIVWLKYLQKYSSCRAQRKKKFTLFLELTAVIPCSMMYPYLLLAEGQLSWRVWSRPCGDLGRLSTTYLLFSPHLLHSSFANAIVLWSFGEWMTFLWFLIQRWRIPLWKTLTAS